MDINQLTENLENLPAQIRTSELAMIEAKGKLEDAELNYDVKLAFETVSAKAGNATEKKSMGILKAEAEQRLVLKASLEYERKKAEFNFLTNRFASVRKIANLLEKTYAPESSGYWWGANPQRGTNPWTRLLWVTHPHKDNPLIRSIINLIKC